MVMDENMRRAQLLADTAFDMLMWNPNGDGTTYTERPISDRQRDSIEAMTALSQAYSDLVGAEASMATVEAHDRAMNMMATGHGHVVSRNSDERDI